MLLFTLPTESRNTSRCSEPWLISCLSDHLEIPSRLTLRWDWVLCILPEKGAGLSWEWCLASLDGGEGVAEAPEEIRLAWSNIDPSCLAPYIRESWLEDRSSGDRWKGFAPRSIMEVAEPGLDCRRGSWGLEGSWEPNIVNWECDEGVLYGSGEARLNIEEWWLSLDRVSNLLSSKLSILSWRERRGEEFVWWEEGGDGSSLHLAKGWVEIAWRIPCPWVGGGAEFESSGAIWLIPCILYRRRGDVSASPPADFWKIFSICDCTAVRASSKDFSRSNRLKIKIKDFFSGTELNYGILRDGHTGITLS